MSILFEGVIGFREITKIEDLLPFLGKIVVVRSEKYYITEEKGVVLGKVDSHMVTWSNGDIGPNLTRMLKKDDVPGNCALTQKVFPFLIRLADKEELSSAFKAVLDGSHKFEYTRTDIFENINLTKGQEKTFLNKFSYEEDTPSEDGRCFQKVTFLEDFMNHKKGETVQSVTLRPLSKSTPFSVIVPYDVKITNIQNIDG